MVNFFISPSYDCSECSSPKFYSLPDEIRFPTFLVEFPLLKSGIGHLITGGNTRFSTDNGYKIITSVNNPLSPVSLKLLMMLMAQKEQQIYLKVRDVMKAIGSKTNSSRNCDKCIQDIQNARISITFLDPSLIPSGLERFLMRIEKGLQNVRYLIRDIVIISSVAEFLRKERRKRELKINFSPEFVEICNSFSYYGYVKVKTTVLERITNKHSMELLTYLFCLKPQFRHSKDYLVRYFLGCSEKALVEKIKDEYTLHSVYRAIVKIFFYLIKALEKFKELGVIKDFSFEEGRLRLGKGNRTAPFPESLTIIKRD